jgi:hypothetical protein
MIPSETGGQEGWIADVLLDLDQQVLVGKAQDRRAANIGAQMLADVMRQLRMGSAADDLDGADHAPLLAEGPRTCLSRRTAVPRGCQSDNVAESIPCGASSRSWRGCVAARRCG